MSKKVLENHVRTRDPNKAKRLKPNFHPFRILSLFTTPKLRIIQQVQYVEFFISILSSIIVGNTHLYRLYSRIGQTKCKSSSSLKHFHFYISMFPPQYQNIFGQNFSSEFIITSSEFIIYILIETWNPFINIKYNEQYDFQNSWRGGGIFAVLGFQILKWIIWIFFHQFSNVLVCILEFKVKKWLWKLNILLLKVTQ